MSHFLIAEDSKDDLFFLKQSLSRAGLQLPFVAVNNGEEAIQYLEANKKDLPVGILLDLKMPVKGGLETLDWIKSHPDFRRITTILFTGSAETFDIARAYELGVNAYIQKPAGLAALTEIVKGIVWLFENQQLETDECRLVRVALNQPPMSAKFRHRPFDVLVVEDDLSDIRFIKQAFETAGVLRNFKGTCCAEEAQDYLRNLKDFSDKRDFPPPSLLLLDLGLPNMAGLELLDWVRKESPCRSLPVTVLTVREDKKAITSALEKRANLFLVKRHDSVEMRGLLQGLLNFWNFVEFPPCALRKGDY
jgi:CheY-like chemotaxis protein